MKRQSELLQHTTTIYLNPQIALYAKELTDRLPGNLKVSLQTFLLACVTAQLLCMRLNRLPWPTMHYRALRVSMTGVLRCSNSAKLSRLWAATVSSCLCSSS